MNAHQPEYGEGVEGRVVRVTCLAPDCGFLTYASAASDDVGARIFADHAAQYEPGRAPDIEVDWEVSALCSVCEDGIGDIEVNDSESLRCKECETTWTITGGTGERAE